MGGTLRFFWWCRRSSIEPTAATSLSSLPQSSTGRFDVSNALAPLVAMHHDLEQIPAAVCGSLPFRSRQSSMISNATVEIDSMGSSLLLIQARFDQRLQCHRAEAGQAAFVVR
jgi:hypothetical protein